jgi:hypothetical protein
MAPLSTITRRCRSFCRVSFAAVIALQPMEDDRGQYGKSAQEQKCLVDAMTGSLGVSTVMAGFPR